MDLLVKDNKNGAKAKKRKLMAVNNVTIANLTEILGGKPLLSKSIGNFRVRQSVTSEYRAVTLTPLWLVLPVPICKMVLVFDQISILTGSYTSTNPNVGLAIFSNPLSALPRVGDRLLKIQKTVPLGYCRRNPSGTILCIFRESGTKSEVRVTNTPLCVMAPLHHNLWTSSLW
jgi:hypothetical protein